jgi:hypothetical protein
LLKLFDFDAFVLDDATFVTPRNPWTAVESPTVMPAQPPPPQAFQNASVESIFMNGTTPNPPPTSMPQPLPTPKLHPGVIGDRAMTRHNSVGSSGGHSNLYDVMLRGNSVHSGLLNDSRISVSPPFMQQQGLSSINANGGNGLGRSVSTQTDDAWDYSVMV